MRPLRYKRGDCQEVTSTPIAGDNPLVDSNSPLERRLPKVFFAADDNGIIAFKLAAYCIASDHRRDSSVNAMPSHGHGGSPLRTYPPL